MVTVLFADMVGSTALSEKLDPEHWRAIQSRYFAALRTTIERHGGTVEKFIGDAVMSIFGVPIVHEDDALRAARAATELGPSLRELNLEVVDSGLPALRLRVGIHTGVVVAAASAAAEAVASGEALATAARLEQAAQPDEVLLGEATYTLIRDAVEAQPRDPLKLRGVPGLVRAYRLLRITGGDVHDRGQQGPFVGRCAELERLQGALDDAIDATSAQLVTIVGPAGAGKSRLIQAFREQALRRARIATGRCLSYGDGITYWPIAEIVRELAEIGPTTAREDLEPRLEALLANARGRSDESAGILTSLLGTREAAKSAEDIAWAVRRLFATVAAQRPLLVIIEDLHWADQVLLELVQTVVALVADAPILILCSARPELFDRHPGWALDRSHDIRVDLLPLSGADGQALLDRLPGGNAIPPSLCSRILTQAEGNPLFIEEMVGKLVDDGVLRESGAGWAFDAEPDDVAVPLGVAALIAARLDGLERGEQATTERASVVGRVFERGAVAELSPAIERPGLDGQLLALIRKEIIDPERAGMAGGEAFRFRHILIRDAAYERLTKAERAVLHERFAAWLELVAGERADEYVEVIAHHYAAAVEYRLELGTLRGAGLERVAGRALDRLVAAGDHAARLFAHAEAARLFGRALRLAEAVPAAIPKHGPSTFDMGLRRAEELRLSGNAWAAVDALRHTIEHAQTDRPRPQPPTRLTAAREQLALCLGDAGDEQAALDVAVRAIETEPAASRTAAHLHAMATHARLLMLHERFKEAIDACDHALPLTREAGLAAVTANLLVTRATAIGKQDLVNGMIELEGARNVAEQVGEPEVLLRAENNLAVLADQARAFDVARDATARGRAIAASVGLERTFGVRFLLNAASAAMWTARFNDAIDAFDEALELSGYGGSLIDALSGRGLARAHVGAPERGLEDIVRARHFAEHTANGDTMAELLGAQAITLWWLERHDEALGCLDLAAGQGATGRLLLAVNATYRVMVLASMAASAAQRHGRGRASGTAVRQLRRAAATADSAIQACGTADGPDWRASILGALIPGELARGQGTAEPEAWAKVAQAERAIGDPFFEAYARWRHAEALAASGVARHRVQAAIRSAGASARRAEAGLITRHLGALAVRNEDGGG